MSNSELISLRDSNSRKSLPKKAFLIVEEDDFPSTFSCPILASSNRKLCYSKEFYCDEDYDSDRDTVRKH